MKRLWKWVDYLLDVPVIGLAWWMSVEAIEQIDSFLGELGVLLTIVFIVFANVSWMHVRMLPRMIRLAGGLSWREELATTLIPANVYLLRRLGVPMGRCLLPTVTAAPVLMLALFLKNTIPDDPEEFVGMITMLLWILYPLPIGFGALGLTFGALMRPDVTPGVRLYKAVACFFLAPILFVILSVAGFYTLVFIDEYFSGFPLELIFFSALRFLLVSSACACWLAWLGWRRACKRFYKFEEER